jgi:hypothetical protein
MDFQVRFVVAGTHYLWVRGFAASSADDWVLAGIDGQITRQGTVITFPQTGDYAWGNTSEEGAVKTRLNVPSAGEHLVTVWMSKDGFIIDKMLLTTDSDFVLTSAYGRKSAGNDGQTKPVRQSSCRGAPAAPRFAENDDFTNPAVDRMLLTTARSSLFVTMGAAQKFYRLSQ